MFRVCVLLVFVCVTHGGFSGTGFFCRDPDTGILHPANSTWSSTTFCGNYHCKIRRKNLTQTVYSPIRQTQFTKLEQVNDKNKITRTKTKEKDEKEIETYLMSDSKSTTKENDNKDDKNDRFLTETEIKSISEMLHKVRKSDLDTIIEVYNLAQEIFNEIDENDIEHMRNKFVNNWKHVYDNGIQTKNVKSYWYVPLHKPLKSDMIIDTQNIAKPIEIIKPIKDSKVVLANPLNLDLIQSMKVKETQPHTPLPTVAYFNGLLTSQDFRKMPYYYPMSNFQRLSSYIYGPKINPTPELKMQQQTTTIGVLMTPPTAQIYNNYQKGNFHGPILLPYPFLHIPHRNPPQNYNLKSIENQFDKDSKPKHVLLESENAILINPDLEDMQDLEVKQEYSRDVNVVSKPINEKKNVKKTRPKWQTDPIPQNVIDDVRAFINEKKILKPLPFPLRRLIKLEKVGKVKHYDELIRKKRFTVHAADDKRSLKNETMESDLFEVYIERKTCEADYTVPGFFRYGNMSRPYPECCPQRI